MAIVDATDWRRHSIFPPIDGNYPKSERPGEGGDISFFGYPETSVSSVTPSITLLSTPDDLPKVVAASASGVSGVGTRRLSSKAFKPYEHTDIRWRLTFLGGGAIPDNEGLTDPRDGSSKNVYTEMTGPEFTAIVRQAGTYTLTQTVYRMTSTLGEVSKSTTSVNFTVTEQGHSHQWFDGANGDDANDGNDPWGFGLTTASYTDSTRTLTQAGAFTSYDHVAATTGNPTGHYNYIYISLAGVQGWYEIASKTSNDSIVLVESLGSDLTNVTSSDGPKQTYSGGNAVNNTFYHFSGNGGSSTQSYTVSSQMRQHLSGNLNEVATPSGVAYMSYNGTARISSSTTVFNIGSNSGNTPPSLVAFYGLDVDGDGNGDPVIGLQSTLTAATDQTFLFDNCTFRRSSTGTALNIQFASSDLNDVNLIWNKCIVDGREADTGRASNRHGMFTREDNNGWQRAIGTTFHTDSDNLTLDHFWYPTGNLSYLQCQWCHFDDSVTGTSYCINTNNGIDGTVAEYISIRENFMSSNALWGVDFSNATNDSGDKTFNNASLVGNKCEVTRGFSLHYSLEGGFIAYNDIYKDNSTDFAIWNQCDTADNTNYDIVAYGNRNYGAPLFNVDDGQHCEIVNNTEFLPTGFTSVGQVDEADLGAGNDIVIDKNNLYAVDGAQVTVDSSGASVASYNSTYSVSNTSGDPSWNDPVNGDFDGSLNAGFSVTEV